MNMLEPEIARTQGHGLGIAPGNQSALYAAYACDRNAGPILGVESFGFDHDLSGGLSRSRYREEKKFAVGEDSVYVKEKEFDFFSAGLGG